jgi:hypothetical protein
MGVHPFRDPGIMDEFSAETLPIDARHFHVYAAQWTPEHVAFFVDGQRVKIVRQSPSYPMQLLLGILVDYVRGYRRLTDRSRVRPRPDGS